MGTSVEVEPRFRALVENSFDLLTVMDRGAGCTYVSPNVEELCGYRVEAYRRRWSRFELVHPEDRGRAREAFEAVLARPGKDVTLELRQRHADESWRWYELKMRNLSALPAVAGIVANHRDITERRAHQDLLAHEATHDALTGLSNRAAFDDHLNRGLWVARQRSEPLAVLMVDLDHFKEVNDTLGHCFGDELLYEVGRRLVAELREADMVARLGGDEFGVLLSSAADSRAAAAAGQRMVLAVEERPIVLSGHAIWVGASVGTAGFPDDGDEPQVLKHRADLAMYEAKRASLGPVAYHRGLERVKSHVSGPARPGLVRPGWECQAG